MPSPPLTGLLPQAAILVCDSLWTIREGHSVSHEDVGQKMFQIARDAGAVYAGHVEAGEEALSRLGARFERRRAKQSRLHMARDLFRAVYRNHHTKVPLRIIVGYCDDRGFAGLTYFGSENDFIPMAEKGIKLIAWPESEAGRFAKAWPT